ncbi:uncharacterized protein LOC128221552 [Mya arenaria]|uniref:uncharacterized protein LOC128221552 n=1 Tax=Mya arenaria TaxID=6604 RepID=UPI0022E38F1C|nr:uncharacterized protein LOC128221552 [Mya arenaria]
MSGLPVWRQFQGWLCVCWCVLGLAAGNALLKPSHRGMVWARSSYNSGSYDYMGVNCGGIGKVQKYDGMCGLCGDPFDGTRHHETGGKYATGDIAKVVKLGQRTLSVQVLLNSKQGGYFEFAICDTVPETRDCFDNNLVKITEGRAQGDQFGYWPEKAGIISLTLEIPDNFACDRCVLQWKYVTGNTWGRDELGHGCRGCGIQETFINCADIRIEGWSRPIPLPTIARPPPIVFLPPPTTTLPPTSPPTQPPTTPPPTEPPTAPPTTAVTTPTVIQSKLTTNVGKQTTAGRLNFTRRRTDVDEGSRRRTNPVQQFTAKGVNPNRNFNYSPPQASVTAAVYAVKTTPPPVNPPTIQPVYEVKKFAVAPEIVANNPAAPVNIPVAQATQASVPAPGSHPSRSIPFPASAVAAVVIPHQSSVEPPLEKTTYVKRAVGDYGRGGGGGPAKIPRPPALSNLQISALNSRANVLSHPDKLQKYVQVGSSQMVVGKDFSTVYTSKNPTTAAPFYLAHYSQSGMGQNFPQAVPYRGSYSRTGAQEQMFGTIPQGNNRNNAVHTGEIMNEYSPTNEGIMTSEQQNFGHSPRRGNGNVHDPWRVEARGSSDSTPPPQDFQRTYDRYGSLLEKTPAPRLGPGAPLKSDIMHTGSANGDVYTSNGITDPGQSQSNHRQFGNHNDKYNNQGQASRDKQSQQKQAWYEGYGSVNIPPPQDNSRYNIQNERYGGLDNNWAPQPPKTTRLPVVDTSTHKETNNNNARQTINSWRRAPVHDAIDITPVPIDKPVNFFKNQDHSFRPPVVIKERFTNYEIGHKGTNQNGPTDTSRNMNTRNYDVPPSQVTASLVDGRSQPLGGDTPTVQVPYEKIYDPSMKLTGQFGNRFQKSETPNDFWYQSGAGLNDLNGKPQMAESYVKPATTTQKPAIQIEIERKMAELKKLEELQRINNRLAQLKLMLGLQVGITPVTTTIATTTTRATEPFHYNNLQDGSMSLSKLDQLKLLLGLTETPTTTTARTSAAPSFDSQYGGDAFSHGLWYNTEQGQQSMSPTQEAKLQQDLWIKLIRGDQGKIRSNVLSLPSKPTTQSYQTTTKIPTNTQEYIADFKTKMLQSIRSANALKGVSDTNGNVSGQSGVSWQQNRWREMSAGNRNSQNAGHPGQSSVNARHWQQSESGAQLGYLKSTPDVQTMQYDSLLPNGARSVKNVETIYQTTTQAQPHTNSPSKNNLIAALRKLIAARSKSTGPPLREMHVENYIKRERINMTTTEAPSPQLQPKAGDSSPSRGGNTSRFSKEQMDMIRRRVEMFKRMRDMRISRPTHITNTRTTNNDRPIHLPNTRPSHLGRSSNLGQEKKWTANNRPTHIIDHPNNNRPTVHSFLQSPKQNNLNLSGAADIVNNGGTTRSYQTPRSIDPSKSYQGHGSSTTRVPSANGALSPFQKLFLATAEKRLSASKDISDQHRERIKKESPVSKGAPLLAESTRDIAIKDLGVHGNIAEQTVKENTQRVKPGPSNKDVLYKLLQALRDKNSATTTS